jgi:predicted nucleic acid-binding Zn ribbon protein
MKEGVRMAFTDLFEETSSDWVRYSKYEFKTAADGKEYLTPTADAEIEIYNPLDVAKDLLADTLNLGRALCEQDELTADGKDGIMNFVLKYGLFGYMTAIPLNGNFMEYPHVFFGRNPYFDVDFMETKEYLEYFQPFGIKQGQRGGFALFTSKALEFAIEFSRNYAERTDWIFDYLREFFQHFLACASFDKTDNPALRGVYAEIISSFREYGLGFQMRMADKPVLVWDFNALKTLMETVYGFVVSDKDEPLRICKHCGKVFFITHGRSLFCSERCRNQFNVYKNRAKKKDVGKA